MATQLQQQADALVQDTLADFVLIRTDQIESGDRLRDIDPVWAQALGQVMAREGQRTPIEVCRLPGRTHWTLVSGGHRLFGAKSAGIAHLRAEIVSADRNDRRMREISENLWRRDLYPIDRAAFIAELVGIKRVQVGIDEASRRAERVNLPLRKQVDAEADEMLDTMSSIYGFTEEVGAELGFSGRTIRRDLLLFRGLAPSLVEQLRAARHPVARNASQLRALAKLDRDRQAQAIGLLLNGVAKTASDAVRAVSAAKAVPAAEDKRLSAFLGAFQRMSLIEKKGALAHLAERLPAGTTLGTPAEAAFPADHERYREEAIEALDRALWFLDGIEEDELIPGERGAEVGQVAGALRMARVTIAGNGFKLGGEQ